MNRILIAVDFSHHSLAAARLGTAIARCKSAEVLLLNAVESFGRLSIPVSTMETMKRDVAQQRQRQLSELAEQLGETGSVPIQSVVREADPARGILGVATEWQADMIVMGSHGADEHAQSWLGSVAMRVAREALCPVVVSRRDHEARFPPDGLFRHSIVAVDYSRFSLPAVTLAAQLAAPESTIELVHILQLPEGSDDGLAEAREAALEKLEQFAHRVDLAMVQVTPRSELGRVADQLLAFADKSNTDAIVVGAHGGDGAASYLGSVADRVLRSSTVPVVLLPDRALSS